VLVYTSVLESSMRRTVRWGLPTGEPSPDPDGLSPDRRSGFEDVGNPPASLPAVPPAGRAPCCEIGSRASGRHFLLRRMRRSQTRIHGWTLHVANAMQPLISQPASRSRSARVRMSPSSAQRIIVNPLPGSAAHSLPADIVPAGRCLQDTSAHPEGFGDGRRKTK